MLTEFRTGHVPGVVISAVAHEAPTVTVDGRPARLAVIDDEGNIIAAGPEVAREVRSVTVNSFRKALIGQGHVRIVSGELGKVAG